MLIQNAIKIIEDLKNPSYIVSKNTHDYNSHTFKNGETVAVDGGPSYIRRCGDLDNGLYEEWNLDNTSSTTTIKNKLLWGTYGKSGKEPLKYVLLKSCETKHLKMILKQANLSELYQVVINEILKDRKPKKKIKK